MKTMNRVALVLALLGCDSKTPPGDELGTRARSQVATTLTIVAARPELGGNLLVLGEHQVELAVQHDGFVRALIFDAQGRRMDEPGSAQIGVTLTREDGLKLALMLARDGQRRCFWGKVNVGGALGLSVIPVTLELSGKVVTGTLSQYALLPAPRFGGQVIAVGGFGVELVATGARVSAHVLDSWGKAVTRIDLELKLTPGEGSALALAWNAPDRSYGVALEGEQDLGTQPLRLALSADGKLHVGGTQSLRAIGELRAAADVAVPRRK